VFSGYKVRPYFELWHSGWTHCRAPQSRAPQDLWWSGCGRGR